MLIKLRELRYDDIKYMKEFYEDIEIKKQFKFTQNNFDSDLLVSFVDKSNTENTHHFAVDCDSEYAGTISLKNCDKHNLTAEFAIVIRKKFWGNNISRTATLHIIDYAFNSLKLNKIYLNVLSSNQRAINFYKKIGFQYEGTFHRHVLIENEYHDINWYAIFNEEMEKSI